MKFRAGDTVSRDLHKKGMVLGTSEFCVHVRWDDYEYDPHDSGPYEQMYHSEYPDCLTLISSEQNEIATYHLDFSEKLVNGCMDMLKDAIQIHSMIIKKGSS